ncbi:hypothetical protein LSTR_LSTR007517 [Laodelphax striatellus]|uniref:Uncharacterized protein n=1 Tax=Laodelphax striatellus TaxID=195883 RepID=A0A482XS68_LAOST|nr:hypothetical protein LSTR_LSTR007517 [Laodelphax striatellus]
MSVHIAASIPLSINLQCHVVLLGNQILTAHRTLPKSLLLYFNKDCISSLSGTWQVRSSLSDQHFSPRHVTALHLNSPYFPSLPRGKYALVDNSRCNKTAARSSHVVGWEQQASPRRGAAPCCFPNCFIHLLCTKRQLIPPSLSHTLSLSPFLSLSLHLFSSPDAISPTCRCIPNPTPCFKILQHETSAVIFGSIFTPELEKSAVVDVYGCGCLTNPGFGSTAAVGNGLREVIDVQPLLLRRTGHACA